MGDGLKRAGAAAKATRRVNSRAKGAAAEREVANLLRDVYGLEARRGQQFSGGGDSPDVVCSALEGYHLEVKFYATCQHFRPAMLRDWDAQATRDAPAGAIPLIVHRWNGHKAWTVRVLLPGFAPVVMLLSDFMPIRERLRSVVFLAWMAGAAGGQS